VTKNGKMIWENDDYNIHKIPNEIRVIIIIATFKSRNSNILYIVEIS